MGCAPMSRVGYVRARACRCWPTAKLVQPTIGISTAMGFEATITLILIGSFSGIRTQGIFDEREMLCFRPPRRDRVRQRENSSSSRPTMIAVQPPNNPLGLSAQGPHPCTISARLFPQTGNHAPTLQPQTVIKARVPFRQRLEFARSRRPIMFNRSW